MGSQKPDAQSSPSSKSNPKPYGNVVLTLKNCLLPEERLSPTPSQLDGLDRETETDLRILGCELIQTAGILLRLPQVAMATGQVIFQRFYYSKSFVRHGMETTAMGCVCLASKIEEAPRRIRDVINVFHHIKQVKSQKTITPVIIDTSYSVLKTQVIKAERRVLKELGFCVHVKHPHKIIVMYLQVLNYEKHQAFMQSAWNYMNDSLRTDVFLRYHPETVASACIYLTARKLKIALPKSPAWWSVFDVSERDIKDVCFRILRLYERPKPNAEELDKRVEILKKQYEDSRLKARQSLPTNNSNNNNQNSVTGSDPNTPHGSQSPSPDNLSQSHTRSRPSSPVKAKEDKHHRSSGWSANAGRNHHNNKHRNSRSRSRSSSRSPKRNKRSKKNRKSRSPTRSRSKSRSRTRSRSQSRDKRSKKTHRKSRRSSYSRSPSPSPRGKREKRYRSRSRSYEKSRLRVL